MSGSPVFKKGLNRLVPSERSCVGKDACGSMGNTGQTSQLLSHSQPAHSPWGRSRHDRKETASDMYVLLAFFLSFSLPLPAYLVSSSCLASLCPLRSRQASHRQPWRCVQGGSLYLLSATVQFLTWLGVRAYLGGTPGLPATPWAHRW